MSAWAATGDPVVDAALAGLPVDAEPVPVPVPMPVPGHGGALGDLADEVAALGAVHEALRARLDATSP